MKQIVSIIILGIFLAMPAAAQNILQNPGFDSDVSGWVNPYGFTVVWDSRDANDSPGSGSAFATNTVGNGGSSGMLSQCFPVSPDKMINFSGKIYQPSGQTGSGNGHIRLRYYTDTACSSYLGEGSSSMNQNSFDTWFEVSGNDSSPSSAQSVEMFLAIISDVLGEDFSVYFDDVVLTIETDAVFTDGFEDGTTSGWSSTEP